MRFKLSSPALLGKTLTLSVGQNGRTAGPVTQTDYGIPGSSAGRITITVDRSTVRCAPDSVRFGVDLSEAEFDTPGPGPGEVHDPRLRDLVFIWNTGDTGTWTAPRNVLPEWNDKSRAKGPWIAHCYTRPGTYAVTLTVLEPESGKIATASVAVDVVDPDRAYSGERTICIDPPGAAAGGWGPADALHVAWDPAHELINDQPWWASVNIPSDRRFLFDPGASYPGRFGFRFDGGVRIRNPYIGAAGPGRVVLNASPSNTLRRMIHVDNNYNRNNPTTDFRISGIDARGTFDPTVELAYEPSALEKEHGFFWTITQLDAVISDCRAKGFVRSAIIAQMEVAGLDRPGHLHVDDTFVTDMGGEYGGIYLAPHDRLPDSSLAVSGTALVQDPDAISGGAQHKAPLRENGMHKVSIRCSECFGQDDDNAGWKICTTPNVEIGHIVNLDGVTAEGTFCPLWIQQNVTQGIGRTVAINMVADGVVIVADYTSNWIIDCSATGVTLRNVLLIVPDSPAFLATTVPGFDPNDEDHADPRVNYTPRRVVNPVIFRAEGAPPAATLAARCAIYNSTLVTRRSPADNGGNYPNPTIVFAPSLADTVDDNNILDGPWPENALDESPYGPLDTTPLWTPYCKGFTGYSSRTLMTEFATPPDAVIRAAPSIGSSALGAAVAGETAHFDIAGRVRPVYPSIGAWEAV